MSKLGFGQALRIRIKKCNFNTVNDIDNFFGDVIEV